VTSSTFTVRTSMQTVTIVSTSQASADLQRKTPYVDLCTWPRTCAQARVARGEISALSARVTAEAAAAAAAVPDAVVSPPEDDAAAPSPKKKKKRKVRCKLLAVAGTLRSGQVLRLGAGANPGATFSHKVCTAPAFATRANLPLGCVLRVVTGCTCDSEHGESGECRGWSDQTQLPTEHRLPGPRMLARQSTRPLRRRRQTQIPEQHFRVPLTMLLTATLLRARRRKCEVTSILWSCGHQPWQFAVKRELSLAWHAKQLLRAPCVMFRWRLACEKNLRTADTCDLCRKRRRRSIWRRPQPLPLSREELIAAAVEPVGLSMNTSGTIQKSSAS
jgi:hypothetical protein